MDFWLKHANAAVNKVNLARVIAAVATGTAAQQLTDYANLGSGLSGGPILGGSAWGFVARQTMNEAGSTVLICTVFSDLTAAGKANPARRSWPMQSRNRHFRKTRSSEDG